MLISSTERRVHECTARALHFPADERNNDEANIQAFGMAVCYQVKLSSNHCGSENRAWEHGVKVKLDCFTFQDAKMNKEQQEALPIPALCI